MHLSAELWLVISISDLANELIILVWNLGVCAGSYFRGIASLHVASGHFFAQNHRSVRSGYYVGERLFELSFYFPNFLSFFLCFLFFFILAFEFFYLLIELDFIFLTSKSPSHRRLFPPP